VPYRSTGYFSSAREPGPANNDERATPVDRAPRQGNAEWFGEGPHGFEQILILILRILRLLRNPRALMKQ